MKVFLSLTFLFVCMFTFLPMLILIMELVDAKEDSILMKVVNNINKE